MDGNSREGGKSEAMPSQSLRPKTSGSRLSRSPRFTLAHGVDPDHMEVVLRGVQSPGPVYNPKLEGFGSEMSGHKVRSM